MLQLIRSFERFATLIDWIKSGGKLIAIGNSLDNFLLNKVFEIKSVTAPDKVIVDYNGNVSELIGITDQSTKDSYGDISKFVSARYSSVYFFVHRGTH
mgnify:CR=1 FL=1